MKKCQGCGQVCQGYGRECEAKGRAQEQNRVGQIPLLRMLGVKKKITG